MLHETVLMTLPSRAVSSRQHADKETFGLSRAHKFSVYVNNLVSPDDCQNVFQGRVFPSPRHPFQTLASRPVVTWHSTWKTTPGIFSSVVPRSYRRVTMATKRSRQSLSAQVCTWGSRYIFLVAAYLKIFLTDQSVSVVSNICVSC